MQSCYINTTLCISELRTKHSLAAHTPRRHSAFFIPITRTPSFRHDIIPAVMNYTHCHFDGQRARGIYPTAKCSLKLLQYLDLAQILKLHECDTMDLLKLFKYNISEACRQLTPELHLAIDAPWRLQVKAIRELKSVELLITHKLYKGSGGRTFVKYPNTWQSYSVLLEPDISLGEYAAGRCVRIQRCFYMNEIMEAVCIMPRDAYEHVQVLFLKIRYKWNISDSTLVTILKQIEEYIMPMILATKSWQERNIFGKKLPCQALQRFEPISYHASDHETANSNALIMNMIGQVIIHIMENEYNLPQGSAVSEDF